MWYGEKAQMQTYKYYKAYLLLNKRLAKPENVLDTCIETWFFPAKKKKKEHESRSWPKKRKESC